MACCTHLDDTPRFEDYAARCAILHEYQFWVDMQAFGKANFGSKDAMKREAKRIYDTYIRPDSEQAVYVDLRKTSQIERNLENPSHSMYQEIYLDISCILQTHFQMFRREHGSHAVPVEVQ